MKKKSVLYKVEIQCILQTAHYNHRGHHHLYNLNKKVIKKKNRV